MRPLASAWRELRTQSLRYGIAGLSMLIGVLGISSIAIVNSVALDMLVAQQEQLHGREASYSVTFMVTAQQLDGELDTRNNLEALAADLTERFASPTVHVALQADRAMQLSTERQRTAGDTPTSVLVKWAGSDISRLQRLPIISGSLPSTVYPAALALNEAAAAKLGYPISDRLLLTGSSDDQPVEIVISAVVADGLSEPTAYGDLDLAILFFPRTVTDENMSLRMQGATLNERGVAHIVATLESHGFDAPEAAQRVDTVRSVRDQVSFLRTVFGACALFILVISAIGTANVGLSSVSERSRELVVRRAIGARRRDVFAQLISGALAVGVLVSAIAVALTLLAVYELVPTLIPAASSVAPPQFPWTACIAGIVAGMTTAVIGGILPAIKATRLSVGLALRE